MSLYDINRPKEKEESLESPTSGSIPMNISGRMIYERERCVGMSNAERQWRAQWLKDQILHDEPIIPENYYKERYNPIRRFYRAPMDKVESLISAKWGLTAGKTVRHMIANVTILLGCFYGMYYWVKYNPGDWTRRSGPRYQFNRVAQYPGDPNFPTVKHLKDNEYATYGFEKSTI